MNRIVELESSPVGLIFARSEEVLSYVVSQVQFGGVVPYVEGFSDIPQYAFMLPMDSSEWFLPIDLTGDRSFRGLLPALRQIPGDSRLRVVVFTDVPYKFFTILEQMPGVFSAWFSYFSRDEMEWLADGKSLPGKFQEYSDDPEAVVRALTNADRIHTDHDLVEILGAPAGTIHGFLVNLLSVPSGDGRATIRNRLRQGWSLLNSYPTEGEFYNKLSAAASDLLQLREIQLNGQDYYDDIPDRFKHFRRHFRKLSEAPLDRVLRVRLLVDTRDLSEIVYGVYA